MRHLNRGTCSKAVDFEVENGIITSCEFIGGCDGNTKGVAALVIGRPVDDVIDILKNIKCGMRPTSCPAQLAEGLMQYKNQAEA